MHFVAQLTALIMLLSRTQALPICNEIAAADQLTDRTIRLKRLQATTNLSINHLNCNAPCSQNESESCELNSTIINTEVLCNLTVLFQLALQVNM